MSEQDTQSPLERAARALCKCADLDPDEMFGVSGSEYPRWHIYKDDARAVLMAIREPSEEMCQASRNAKFPKYRDGKDHSTLPRWQAMIDCALELQNS